MKQTEGSRTLHFLVIDDDDLSRELVTILLQSEDHEVLGAASGELALALLRGDPAPTPDVVLSDIQMPGISGKALATALRQAVGEKTKLLAMSGSRPSETVLERYDGFLLKPFSMDDLNAALADAKGPHRPVSDASGQTGGVPALNEDIYAKMAQMVPAPQLAEMYAMCLADARKRIVQMTGLAQAGDDEGFRRAAHTVKGGCGMIGAAELYALAETAERDGLPDGPGPKTGTCQITTLMERFSYACERLERILAERR